MFTTLKKQLIGCIRTQSNLINSEIIIGEKQLYISRNKWETTLEQDGQIICNLKTNSFSGRTTIIETGQKIAGVFGFKWGTQLLDKDNNTLVRIRNENQFINRNRYEIEILNEKSSDLDILLTLYGHLYGSKMKQRTVLIVIIATIVSRVIFN